jgi:hypothetical protein
VQATAVDVTELLVGLVTLAAAVPAWHGGGIWFRVAAVVLAVAGVAAIAHAIESMTS